MGVAAAYLGELVTEELKAMAIEDREGKGGAAGTGGGAVAKRLSQARPEEPTRIVVVAPQEGQVPPTPPPWDSQETVAIMGHRKEAEKAGSDVDRIDGPK